MKKTKLFFLPSRQIFMAGGPSEGQSMDKERTQEARDEVKKDALDSRNINAEGKKEAEQLISGQQDVLNKFQAEQLKGGEFQNEYKAEPFSSEELREKTKGYPELTPPPTSPFNIVELGKQNYGGKMDHGDTSSLAIDLEDGKGEKEYIVLMDKSGKAPKYRVFKQK